MSQINCTCGTVKMKTLLIGIFTLVILVRAVRAPAPDNVCLQKPATGTELGFMDGKPANFKFVCPGGVQDVRMHCCMHGYSHIEWYEFVKYKQEWRRFITNDYTRVMRENNQSIVIFGALKERDGTNFSCVGHGVQGEQVIRNNITLQFENCDTKGPSKFVHPEQNKTIVEVQLESEKNLYCNVYFGNQQCATSGCMMWWTKQRPMPRKKDRTEVETIRNNRSERIWFSEQIGDEVIAGHQGFGETTLHIRSITPDDLEWSYVCGASTVDDDSGRTFLLIKGQVPDTNKKTVIYVAAGICGAFVAVVLVAVTLSYKFNVEIRVCIKTKLRGQRTVKGRAHDVFLLYNAEADRDFAENVLYPYLSEDLNYEVLTQRRFSFGEPVFANYSNAMDASSVMVVTVTQSLLQEEECKLCIRAAINGGHRTIYVIKDDLKPEADYPKEDRDIMFAASVSKVTWCENKTNDRQCKILCRHGETVDSCKKKLHLKLLTLLEEDSPTKTGCMRFRSSGGKHEQLVENCNVPNV